jgi:NAD(P)-dependent dehydrogenase (short-subunit alcohol dehydrogenase family)
MTPRPPAEQLRLDGRVVAVAGAGGGGIGTAVCVALASAGATVIGLDTSATGRATVEEQLAASGGTFVVLDVDVCDEDQLRRCLRDVGGRHAPVDVLVNVVGGMRRHHWGALDEMPWDALVDLLWTNLAAPATASRVVAAGLREHGKPGAIVHIASVAGLTGMPYGAIYGAAKAAVINLTRSMAVEWGPSGIRVNAVAPGTIVTPKLGRERFDRSGPDDDGTPSGPDAAHVVPLRRRGTPDDVAGVVTFLLSDLASYVSGQTIVVDGGMLARPAFADAEDMPAFVLDSEVRARVRGERR